jgi:1,2-phenylacetyl-CoA epoxidase PaaB subunit
VVPAGQLWSGVPAVFVRTRTPEEIAQATEFVQADRELAQVYVAVSKLAVNKLHFVGDIHHSVLGIE